MAEQNELLERAMRMTSGSEPAATNAAHEQTTKPFITSVQEGINNNPIVSHFREAAGNWFGTQTEPGILGGSGDGKPSLASQLVDKAVNSVDIQLTRDAGNATPEQTLPQKSQGIER